MDKNRDYEASDDDIDESFKPTFQRKGNVHAIIDSEEEEEEEGEEEDSVIDDSFKERSPNQNSVFNMDHNEDFITSSDDDEDNHPTKSDIVETTDDEDGEPGSTNYETGSLKKKITVDNRDNRTYRNNIESDTDESDDIDNDTKNGIYRSNIESETDDSDRDERTNIEENVDYDEKHDNLVPHQNCESDVDKDTNIGDDSVDIINDSLSVVDISSEDEHQTPVLKQPSIKSFMMSKITPKMKNESESNASVQMIENKRVVSEEEYQNQIRKVRNIEADLLKARNALKVIKLENLPDKGKNILDKEKTLQKMCDEEKKVLNSMSVDENKNTATARDKIEVSWDQIQAGVGAVAPRTFGKKGVARFNMEKQLAVETLDTIHKSLDTCPTEKDYLDDPRGLKVELMPHQRRALAWLLWREKQKPSGGILADDMGLGKTLTMISVILKCKEMDEDDDVGKENYRDKYPGGTLVVCPASLLNQWSGEIKSRCKRGLLDVEVYHGAKRESKAKNLARHDVVVTTYSLILSEHNRNGAVFGVRWRRIILDEAHQIRNYKSQTAEAVFRLSGKSRWALSGTPVHNKELDMYAILKYLRCSPFDDLQVWKHWVSDKSTGGDMRLHAVISSLMLRRTKAELMEKGSLTTLPTRNWELVSLKLEKDEMDVYQKVLIFSRTLFAQFLHQRAEKNQDAVHFRLTGAPPDPNGEYFKMRNKLLKLNRVKEVSQHEILVLLLRLRQICCHPSLIREMLHGDEDLGNADDDEEAEELNLLEQLNRLNVDDDEYHPGSLTDGAVGLKEASKGYLNPSNPVFVKDYVSSKIKTLIPLLKKTVSGEDKAIIVSQWTSLLDLIAIHLKREGIPYDSLTGKIPVHKRTPIVDNFNDPNTKVKVLLLSLTAGGVGLNLIGANNLFLLDLHWNPQLETQAQDRIYRVGQEKHINVFKLMAAETIEERIKALQEKKLEIADAMLTGSKRVANSKLTLQDLKMIFDFQ